MKLKIFIKLITVWLQVVKSRSLVSLIRPNAGVLWALGSIKNIHLSYFRNLKFVFSVLICSSSVFCILALGSGQHLLRVRVRVSVSFTVLCLQRWRCIFLMCPRAWIWLTSAVRYIQDYRCNTSDTDGLHICLVQQGRHYGATV